MSSSPENPVPSTPSASDQVNWFRNSSPYINAHRGRTFVVLLGGEVLDTPRLPTLVHDLALLNALGVKLVLVHGARRRSASGWKPPAWKAASSTTPASPTATPWRR
jgi:hypothetical protein